MNKIDFLQNNVKFLLPNNSTKKINFTSKPDDFSLSEDLKQRGKCLEDLFRHKKIDTAILNELYIADSLKATILNYQKTYDDQVYMNYLTSLGFRVIKENGFDNLKTFFICYK